MLKLLLLLRDNILTLANKKVFKEAEVWRRGPAGDKVSHRAPVASS